MPRPLDPTIDRAIEAATLRLLGRGLRGDDDRGRGGRRASASRRSTAGTPTRPALVAAVVAARLPVLDVPDLGDTRAELWQAVELGFPDDGAAYVALIGGLMAEHRRHPELIDAFRRNVLLPRRAVGLALVERGQRRGDIRTDIEPVTAIDLFAGPFLARVFAGEDTGITGARRPSPPGGTSSEKALPMIDFTIETHLDRSPADGLRLHQRPERLPTWQTNTVSSVPRRRPLGVGTRLREVHRGPGGKELVSVVEVSEFEPGRVFALQVVEGTPVHLRITLDRRRRRHAGALPRVRRADRRPMRLTQPLLGRVLKRQFTQQVAALQHGSRVSDLTRFSTPTPDRIRSRHALSR